MQRYTALWTFPVLSLVLVVFMTVRSAEVVDAPEEPATPSATDVAALAEQRTNLQATLAKSVAARVQLERHVAALHEELTELRASRTAIVAEAELWRESYGVLAGRFDELVQATRSELATASGADGAGTVSASFRLEAEAVPQPSGAVIVR